MAGGAGRGAFRRRILIEPGERHVTAELEDDYHRMVVTLRHDGRIIEGVTSAMKRAPWTGCPGAIAALAKTMSGVALAEIARRGEKTLNCTHLYDLALFAAAHAGHLSPAAYEVRIGDPVDRVRRARLWRDGVLRLDWTLDGDVIVAPGALAGRGLRDLGGWIATQDADGAEAGRILRWAAFIAHGRATDMPAGMPATAFPMGACFNFQPDTASCSTRVPGADVDFSREGREPMMDRAGSFAPVAAFDPPGGARITPETR